MNSLEQQLSIHDLNQIKRDCRSKFRALRNSIVRNDDHARLLKNNFLSAIDIPDNSIISSYIPINSEIDVIPLSRKLMQMGHKIVMPIEDTQNDVLIFKGCKSDVKIMIEIQDDILEPDILIVPMLAFDRTLMRLGYGKGWYDKTIINFKKQNKRNKFLVGVAYNTQFSMEKLPRDDFDQFLDIIVTEEVVYNKTL